MVFYDLLKHSILLKLYCHVVQLSHETCTCDKTMEGIQLVLSHFQILQYCYGSWKGPGCNLKIALSVLELSAAVLSYHGCIPNMTSGYLMETLQPPSKFLHLGNTFFLFCDSFLLFGIINHKKRFMCLWLSRLFLNLVPQVGVAIHIWRVFLSRVDTGVLRGSNK